MATKVAASTTVPTDTKQRRKTLNDALARIRSTESNMRPAASNKQTKGSGRLKWPTSRDLDNALARTVHRTTLTSYYVRPPLVQLRMELTERAWTETHGNVPRMQPSDPHFR